VIRLLQTLWSFMRQSPRVGVVLLALVLLGVGTACVFLWVQHHLHAAQEALDRYDFAEAQHHLELCLKVRSSNALRVLASQAARRRDAYEEAEQHLAACGQMMGMTGSTALERLLLTVQQGDDLDELEALLKARTGPSHAEAPFVLEALAKGYENRFWHADALSCLNQLLERSPEHSQALLMRARIYEDLARISRPAVYYNDALRDYEKAVALRSTPEARLGLAGALYRVGRPWDAMLEYERLRQERRADPEVVLGLARCRFNLHEVDEARRLLEELLERHPGHADGLLERGRLEFHAGYLSQAEEWLRQAVDAAPPIDVEPRRLLCQCLEAQQKSQETRDCLASLRESERNILRVDRIVLQANRDSHNGPLRYQAAVELLRLGREKDAVATAFLALAQDPRHGPSHALLADYFERTGQPRRAARHRRATYPAASPRQTTAVKP
jgi:tetratricopeptide (TPR) repeat protein